MSRWHFTFLNNLATCCRLISQMIGFWKPLALAAYCAFTTVPHIRVQDVYGSYPNRYQNYHHCLYLGSRGVIIHQGFAGHGCPWVVIVNSNQHRKFYE